MFVNATYRVMRIMDEVKAAPEIVALGDVEVECKTYMQIRGF